MFKNSRHETKIFFDSCNKATPDLDGGGPGAQASLEAPWADLKRLGRG